MTDHGAWAFSDAELAKFEDTNDRLMDAAVSFARRHINDEMVRREYIQQAENMSRELRQQISLKRLSPRSAAEQANELRNVLRNAMRQKTSDFGLALARHAKDVGKSLPELEAYYAEKLFNAEVGKLTKDQRNKVWCEIVAAAGRPRVSMSSFVRWLSGGGKTVYALTVIVTVHHVMKSDTPMRTLLEDTTEIAGAVAGSAVLGAIGSAYAPASIFRVGVAIFVGGVVGSYSAEWVFDRLWGRHG